MEGPEAWNRYLATRIRQVQTRLVAKAGENT